MKFFGRSTKIAGSLAAALMISAPLALAATPTFAATMHDNDRHDGDRNKGGDRHDNDRDNHRGNNDRDDHGVRHERMAFRHHGHWGYSHGHRMWIVAFHGR